jgi:type I restriction enzyme S subunit
MLPRQRAESACEGRLVPTEAELARHESRSYEPASTLLARVLDERYESWTGRGKYKEPTGPDNAELYDLPEGWTWVSLEQLSRSSSYGTSAKCSYENTGPPVLRIPNIAAGRIDLADLKFAEAGKRIERRDELAPGDLLIIRTNGSKNLIGRSAVVKAKLDRATSYASYLIRFRLTPECTLFGWVAAIWDSSFLRTWIERRAATSAGQHNISMSVLSTLPVPLPPLAEQERIVAEVERRLSVIEELAALVAANLQRATRLRQSLLHSAFSGFL